jgi:hypothetical protein
LFSFCIAMAALNVLWWENGPNISPIRPDKITNPAEVQPLGPETAEPNGSSGVAPVESLLRPLFHPTRRPFVAPPPVAVEEAEVEVVEDPTLHEPDPEMEVSEPPPEFRLAGISGSADGIRVLLGMGSGGDFQWYRQGDELSGWKVTAITKLAVTLQRGEQNLTFPLYPTAAPTDVAHE